MSYDFASQPFTVLVPNTPDDPTYHSVPPTLDVPGTEVAKTVETTTTTAVPVTWGVDFYSPYNFTQTTDKEVGETNNSDSTPTVVSLDEREAPEQVPPVQYITPRPVFPSILSTLASAPMAPPPPTFIPPPLVPPPLIVGPASSMIPQQLNYQPAGVGGIPLVLPTVATNIATLTPQHLSTVGGASLVPGNAVANNLVPTASTPIALDTNAPAKSSPTGTGDCHWVNITNYLNLPQSEAAKQLNIPTSSLSKRWKESARNRKWPYRAVCKLDKEIMTVMHNIPPGSTLPPDIEDKLSKLLKERQEMLKPVIIRL